ncbi:UNVERIFIED_CONTAM: NAD(FAD)-utilizing dehydrogenase [Halobacillus marinus]|uniref:NAD(FAD)-utilizing dehydrogenase n=1 Tax=Bacillus sp. SB49 TaxID=1071080 RepID=UPI0004220449|nr:NAD(FAD)-utilizing dehydrogenase [Bacillus sp. SB49]QHT46955.1 NAD(FAD)-utilizing dehydrogenase [Bacillus sp. SB49]
MYDVTIIGAGVSAAFLACRLAQKRNPLSIKIIDKGKPLANRFCGSEIGQSCTCGQLCDRYFGFGGLGKSEGKFNYTNAFGGELYKKIGSRKAMEYMKAVDDILCDYGGDVKRIYHTWNKELAAEAREHSLEMLTTSVRHLGTKVSKRVFQNMFETLKKSISFSFQTDVYEVTSNENVFLLRTSEGIIRTKKVIFATGKSGSDWMLNQAAELGLKSLKTRLDLGLRVEMKRGQLDSILDRTFETKWRIAADEWEATTYCMNPDGRIIRKFQHGWTMADGQNQYEGGGPSGNLNFTLFVPQYFHTYEAAMKAASKVLGGINRKDERILVQRLGDLRQNKPTSTLTYNRVKPSLAADPGFLKDEVPDLYISAMETLLRRLENWTGVTMDEDTLLYGMDAKFYEPKMSTDRCFETEISGLYLAGDCSGETHSLSQAAASGVYIADVISKQLSP